MIRTVANPAGHDAHLMQSVYTAGSLVGVLVGEELEKAGVAPELFSFLGWITLLQPVSPGGLAAETGMPPTTIRDYVRRLVERGDIRSYHLVLTAQGRRLSDRGWPAVVASFERLEPLLGRPAAEYLAIVEELRAGLRQALAERPAAAAR